MTESLCECRDREAIVKLADAVNQVAMVVEEISYWAVQNGYVDTSNGRRRRWKQTLDEQREIIAELIPE